jgi:hypothetical protein
MAKKAKKTDITAQAVATPALVDTLPDISNLSEVALAQLVNAANTRRYELQNANAAEREEAWEEAKKSEAVVALKGELKELQKEFSGLLKNGHTVTYNVPLTLKVNVESYDNGYYSDDLIAILERNGYTDLDWESLFSVNVEGSIGKSDLPKDVKTVMEENLEQVLSDACSQVARLTPELVKQFEAFCKKAGKFGAKAEKLHAKLDTNDAYSVESLLGE